MVDLKGENGKTKNYQGMWVLPASLQGGFGSFEKILTSMTLIYVGRSYIQIHITEGPLPFYSPGSLPSQSSIAIKR
jgi:hypothetical protein